MPTRHHRPISRNHPISRRNVPIARPAMLQRGALLAGSSLAVLLMSMGLVQARALNGGSSLQSAPNIATNAAAEAARAVQGIARQTQESLARAARSVQDMQAIQAAARAAAAARQTSITAPVSVPNGLGPGGLEVAQGGMWYGANGPTSGIDNAGQTQVGIKQTKPQAILEWTSFNVGARTTLTFDQQGDRTWTVLNRVTGVPGQTTPPSQILGNIKADGQVLVINQNGIIFGGGSQVNVGSLIASTAGINNDQFLINGIYSTQLSGQYQASFTEARGAVVVEQGALIATHVPSDVRAGGGFVALFGARVDNAGSLSLPRGQALLAAGDDFVLRPGFSTAGNQTSTTRGSEVLPLLNNDSTSGTVRNSGMIYSPQGDITLAGHGIRQDGVLLATTSVNQRGTIHLLNCAADAAGSVTLTGRSLTTIVPELESRDTALNSQRDALIADSLVQDKARAEAPFIAQFDNLTRLADRQDQSRVEIVTGGVAKFDAGSLTMAQGGQVSVMASTRIALDAGAMVDVSGSFGPALAMSSNTLKVNVQGFELRDSPLNRDVGALQNANVYIDARDLVLVPAGTGGYASDRYYTQGGLLELSGHLANTGHTIGEWTAVGGSVTLSAPQVTAEKGAIVNLAGGAVSYAAGNIITTNLLGADGRIYSIGSAASELRLLGLAGSFRRTHNIQGQHDKRLDEVWTTIFDRGAVSIRHEDAYTVGRDGGQLNLLATKSAFEATLVADVVNGRRQTGARPKGLNDAYKATQTTAAVAGRLSLADLDRISWTVIGTGSVTISAGKASDRDAPNNWFDASDLSRYGMGGISVSSVGAVDLLAPLQLTAGGVLTISGGDVTIGGNVTAPGGAVTVNAGLGLTVKQGVTIDTRGLWTNAWLDPKAVLSRTAFINGGAISLTALKLSLEKDSRLDASAGGVTLTNRKTIGGDGGDITLAGQDSLALDGKLASYGFGKGGKLSILSSAPITIGGVPLRNNGQLGVDETAPVDLVLAEPLDLPAGVKAPVSLTITTDRLDNGQTVPAVPGGIPFNPPNDITIGSAGWTVPAGSEVYDSPNWDFVPVGTYLPPGTVIAAVGVLPAGYVIPLNTFVGPLIALPFEMSVPAGTVLTAPATVPAGAVISAGSLLGHAAVVRPVVALDPSLFSSGFSSYAIRSAVGVAVLAGTQVAVTQPVFQFTADRYAAATGNNPHDAVLPPLFMESLTKGVLTQRGGADLIIGNPADRDQRPFDPKSPTSLGAKSQGGVVVASGAAITVDPGRNVSIGGTGQITIDGAIIARGGAITIVNNAWQEDITAANPYAASGRSVWIGDSARLDASGLAATATDLGGRSYGFVSNGGTIILGAVPQAKPDSSLRAGNAFVVLRPGSVIDVSGTSAVLDLISATDGVQSRVVASDGGSITLASQRGIVIDGAMRSFSGGAGGGGGALRVMLETPILPLAVNTNVFPPVAIPMPDEANVGRVITVSQTHRAGGLSSAKPGELDPALELGQARLGVDQVTAGGFDALSLWARGAIAFDGNVMLSLARSLTLQQGPLVNTTAGARATLGAPYILLDGQTRQFDTLFATGDYGYRTGWNRGIANASPVHPAGGTLAISGALVDVRNQVMSTFDDTRIDSGGDLRMLAATGPAYEPSSIVPFESILAGKGNLTVTAGQIYPVSGARGVIAAGTSVFSRVSGSNTYFELRYGAPGLALTIGRHGDVPTMPYSVFGSLSLQGETIAQGGIVRAPMGAITIGSTQSYLPRTAKVELLPGSITSVSTRGLVIPYGGTADGVSYTVDGNKALSPNLISGADPLVNNSIVVGITIAGGVVTSDPGSVVDLSGGGLLAGAAFVTGRGGSVDTLLTPLINSNPGNSYSAAGNKVYAIVPGVVTAPVLGSADAVSTGAVPGIGQQITVPAGVPGLPADTYTLLPANYALLPGAYRVELASTISRTVGDALPTGNGSYRTYAYQGIANTVIRDTMPTPAIITPAAAVRALSHYNEQGYASFAASQAQQFGTLRSMTEVDARALTILLRPTATDPAGSELVFDGRADFSRGEGGFDGSLSITGNSIDLVITGPGSTTMKTASRATVSADAIAAIGAPTIYIGGAPNLNQNQITISGASNLTLESGVRLSGSSVFLNADGVITLEQGAMVNTLGRGFHGVDASSGLFVRSGYSGALVVVSNGDIRLDSPTGTGLGQIIMKDGSGLYSDDTIGFFSDLGLSTEGRIGIGTRKLALNVASFNIGNDASLAAVGAQLPVGLRLTQNFLDTLLQGGTIAGAPAVERLMLSAGKAINFFGSVDLNFIDPATGRSKLSELVLATPAIHGYGAASDSVHITTDTLVWSGQAVVDADASAGQNIIYYKSAAPGARIAGLGDGGAFSIDARQVVFGDAAQARPNGSPSLDRLMLGFGSISFNAAERITANGKGTFSAYGGGPDASTAFDPKTYAGTGGSLTFNTPLMTTDSGAVFSVYGNAVAVASTGAAALPGSLGGDLSITGNTLRVASAIVLPSGRIALAARGAGSDLVIADGGRIDVAGHAIDLGGVARQGWGGDVSLSSVTGNVVLAPGASLDLSSDGSDAGKLTVTAAGAALLDGAMTGRGGNGAREGAIEITAANLGGAGLSDGFAALNRKLTASGFIDSRAFTLSGGNLVVGADVTARNVSITVNAGSLTIAGRVDATGSRTGAIRLAARDDLQVTAGGMLDVRGTSLVRDSYGQIIDASNRNSVELTSSQGWVRLDAGATVDTSSSDGVARGHVDINARRVDETGGDIKIDASGPLNLRGIAMLNANGFWTYSPTDANGTIVQDNGTTVRTDGTGTPINGDGKVGLDQIDGQNVFFYGNALNNVDLQARLAGLRAAGDVYHLRPGVEITSSAASGDKLTVSGDLDLSGYRYGPHADRDATSATYGFGEALALSIRAAGDLSIKGSINDGFAPPKPTPDDNGFRDRFSSQVTPAHAAPWDYYQLTGTLTLADNWTVPTNSYVYGPNWEFYPAGTPLTAGTVINFSSSNVYFMTSGPDIPALEERVPLPGKIWAIAPMLAPGALSSSIRLVSGADLASADMRGLRPVAALDGSGNTILDDYHSTRPNGTLTTTEIFSVIRTGTGNLELLSGGNFTQKTLYGIYTAGSQLDVGAGFHLSPVPLGASFSAYSDTANTFASYYPDHGGDLLVKVQGDLGGRGIANSFSTDREQWLSLQGSDAVGQPTAWSINFGRYKVGNTMGGIAVAGVTGFGAYGGGNVQISVGGDAGGIALPSFSAAPTGLVAGIGSTGRVIDGQLIQTGGGELDIRIGGGLNPRSEGGKLIAMRGDLTVAAGSIGARIVDYSRTIAGDPRGADPYAASVLGLTISGPTLTLSDAAATLRTRGNLSFAGAADPGIFEATGPGSSSDAEWNGAVSGASVATWFSLWRPQTGIDLLSLGGDVALASLGLPDLPATFRAASASGNLYMMRALQPGNIQGTTMRQVPADHAALELLALGSIYASKTSITMSAADASQMPDPLRPAYVIYNGGGPMSFNTRSIYDPNLLSNNPAYGRFAFVPDTPLTNLHAADPDPVLVRAVTGDIVGLEMSTAKRLDLSAAGDIVGTQPISILNAQAADVSSITAGGEIYYPAVTVAGPGALAITAGKDIYLGDQVSVVSTGAAFAADKRPGASITMTAGVGAAGPNYAGLLTYLDPVNLAASDKPLADQPGKVAKVYDAELQAWLLQRYGYEATDGAAARSYFAARAPAEQQIFLRQIYYAELTAGGREYNDAGSSRYGSYLRGREAIATLFPADRTYSGDIIMFSSGSGNARKDGSVRTLFGGDIQMLAPGGRLVLGVEGVVPGANAGVVTQGDGNIQMYAQGSILLGLSRIMTTFGGNIIAWSAEGDINAGRGSKTTTIYTPPRRIYDNYGNVVLAPVVPSSGAGIATLNPIPEVAAGDIDLIAPLGTIDAGEAGIRFSGNINLAALQIVNAVNITGQGTATGIPTVQAPSIAAALSSSNATAATQQSATPSHISGNQQPSVIIVEVLGYGGGDNTRDDKEIERRDTRRQSNNAYDSNSVVRVLGDGALTPQQTRELSEEERKAIREGLSMTE